MNKSIQIRLKDSEGAVYKWTCQWIKGAFLCGEPMKKGRHADGWIYTSHDGCERFVEGNWLALVAAFKRTAANYGFTLCSELS